MNSLVIRSTTPYDAQGFIALWQALDSETEFMLFEPGERHTTLEEQKKRLEQAAGSDNVAVFVVEDPKQNQLAGFTAGRRDSNFRDNHKLYLVIGLRQCYTAKGLGSQLLHELESWALAHQIRRLDLSVTVSNHATIKLYKRHGLAIEGTRRDSVQLKSGYFDEYNMGKLLAN